MYKGFIPFMALGLVMVSCVKDIVLDAGEEPEVVVECLLTEDPVQELYLSYTKGVSLAEADPLLEAEALLVDLDEYGFSAPFSPTEKGKWVLDYSAIPGHSYLLEVKVPGHELITAYTTMPASFEVKHTYFDAVDCYLSSVPTEMIKLERYGFSGGSFYYNFPDHCWIYFINDDGSIAETICTNFPGVDDFNLTGEVYVPDTVLQPVFFPGNKEDRPDSYPLEKDCYLYPVLLGEGLHNRYLRIPKGEIIPWTIFPSSSSYREHYSTQIVYYDSVSRLSGAYNISGSFNVQGLTGHLCFEVLSEEYDEYLAAAIRAAELEDSTDFYRIYLRSNILKTNIQGGIGIFGAKKLQILEWNKWYTDIDYPT